MENKRKDKRLELSSELVIKKLDDTDANGTKAKINIKDVSKSGIGFTCDYSLSIGSVYECFLTIWTKETLHTFVEIVRMNKIDGVYNYGGIFIGMSEMDQNRIGVYETFEDAGLN